MSCGFTGNTDIYGIGIRIGYYTQALAVWFSNFFLYREAKALRAVNNLFLLALMIVAVIYFVNATTTHVIEAFLLLQIGLVIGIVGITETSRFSSKYIKTSKERLILRMIIIIAGGLLNVCFWWKGLDIMMPTPCNGVDSKSGSGWSINDQEHGTYIWYVVKADIYGWAGKLMKLKSIVAIVWTAPKIVTFDAVVLFYDFRMRRTRASFIEIIGSRNRMSAKIVSEGSIANVAPGHTDTVTTDARLLKGVDDAKKYIEDLFSIYPTRPPTHGTNRHVRLCRGCIRFSIPQHESQCNDTSTPYMQCLWIYLKSNFTNIPSFDLRWRVALHMTASGQHPLWRWPRLVHRMAKLEEKSQPPDWRYVAIASDIMLTQIPLVITSRIWILMAAWQFGFIAVLVLQVELTIAWNHVSGLQSLSSLGQLIPFILGVGGLGKVLWGKWRMVSKGVTEEELAKHNPMSEYEEAMAKCLKSRKPDGEKLIVRAATT